MTSTFIRTIAVSGSNLFAGTGGGVFLSIDNGTTWADVSGGLTSTQITALGVIGSNLFAGTYSGVWCRPLSEMIDPATVTATASSKHNVSTYPNPFSQSTTISFTPEASGYAEVSIVNLLGVEVARLFAGELGAGKRTFEWKPSEVPDGMYECLVRMNGRVKKISVMLVR
ncbi:MAG: T9SS type A sorting domain-containing protein [Bacteroidota bacterium]|nr:T9SS type A sorting domain-containing protein [Bacteroidota bacterium]MDP4233590.1 T9SS type A sorting domain-containing protein [Bacteroidota bacterium]MDP4243636.1 T9SS type A sorting domain-containing protein [Bacteroidota bacterium]MDP4287777.1 T9SS type A sorting domain-containing protein [Bacteroidota bacterium]